MIDGFVQATPLEEVLLFKPSPCLVRAFAVKQFILRKQILFIVLLTAQSSESSTEKKAGKPGDSVNHRLCLSSHRNLTPKSHTETEKKF